MANNELVHVDVYYFDVMYDWIINNINSKWFWYHVQIFSIVLQLVIQNIKNYVSCSISVQVEIKKIQKLCDQYGT